MERMTLARYFPLSWKRQQPLWGSASTGKFQVRPAGVKEGSHVRANECPYAALHGMSLSAGGFADQRNSDRKTVGYTLLMELQWIRDPQAVESRPGAMEDVTSEAARRLNDTDQFVILLNVCAAIFGSFIYCLLTMRQRQSNEQRSSYFAGPFVSLGEASQSWKVYRQWTNKTERDMHVCNFCGFAIKASPSEAAVRAQDLGLADGSCSERPT
eukprot:g25583.t1